MARLHFALARRACMALSLTIASCLALEAAAQLAAARTPQANDPAVNAKAPPRGLGQLLIHDARGGAWQRLCAVRYHANVVLSAPVALVQIDQTFYNPYDGQEEGTFVLNLPLGASVCRFAMYVTPSELVEGELVERRELVESEEYLVRRQQVPAILSEIGDNLFRMRVSPVPGRDVKRILLDYTVPLESEPDGECQFTLPILSDLEPVWDFRVTGRILGPVPPESVVCPSHPELAIGDRLAVDASGGNETANPFGGPGIPFELVRQAYEPREPFTLRVRHAPEDAVTLQTYRAEPPRAKGPFDKRDPTPDSLVPMTYFRIELQGPGLDEQATGPLDLLVLADTSALMRGRTEVPEVIGRLIDHLRPEDRVRLVCVDAAARPLHDGWLAPDSAELADARKRFGNEFCLGGIDLVGSLHEAVASLPPVEAGRRRLAVYVGSGGDTLGPSTDPELVQALTRLLNEARVPLLAMHVSGSSEAAAKQNAHLSSAPLRGRSILEAVARATGGLIWESGDTVEQGDFQRWLDRGMPTPVRIGHLRVTGVKADDLFFPTAWLPGETLAVLGRMATSLTKDGIDLEVTTHGDGEPMERRYPLTVAGQNNNMLIGRLWAQQKLRRLAPLVAAKPWEHTAKVVDVCREWSLLSPQMTFVMIDGDGPFFRWGFDPLRRRYWNDDGVAQLAPVPQAWRDRLLAARQSTAARHQ
ncbi:MAG: VIT and VWA domain-containing protein, partial [Patescibacteria group bacterium]|nr:VIT and VWA domain-containing protein [Patescibacteria group bacterium]